MPENASKLIDDINNPPINGNSAPFLRKVDQPGGRPTLDSYLEPEEIPEMAASTEKIMENYPFFGTLLKQDNGYYRRKEVISRDRPQTIEQVESVYGPGKYQLRLRRENGNEEQIFFAIPETHQRPERETSKKMDQDFLHSLRREMKQETREEFETIVDSLERRLKAKDGELDDLTGKVRRLTMELAETERSAGSRTREELSSHQDKIENLKEEIQDLKFENFELQQELKYTGEDNGFNIKEILNDALKNPDLVKLLSPLLARFQQNSPALAGSSPQEQGGPEQPEHAGGTETTQQSNQNTSMQQLLQQFAATVIQSVSQAMLTESSSGEAVKTTINQGLQVLQTKGVKPETGLWVGISKQLIDLAIQHGVSASKAAETIAPVIRQISGVAEQLRYVTPDMAAEYLINRFGIQAGSQQKKFLIDVIRIFKDELKKQAKQAS